MKLIYDKIAQFRREAAAAQIQIAENQEIIANQTLANLRAEKKNLKKEIDELTGRKDMAQYDTEGKTIAGLQRQISILDQFFNNIIIYFKFR